ncbi:DUF4126 domain-containing protein [Anatilimnocola floriformis]|uniref:DUF4126 domain-containing protein n=1 Tax=Anatilimnocola floriformis TaxID=2948575 RepID=UPI0020C5A3D5|nr:DUF4126 domain-containing protein [Anatilimnocola floriformis]
MEWLLSICLGVGLSAACGFRIFVPMLGLSIAAQAGHLQFAHGFEWIGSPAALVCFGVATVIEIIAFYVPWLDNVLDTMATPAAVVAGTILTASVVTDMSPLMQWSVALIAGGGAAGVVQTGTVLLRGASTATTGGTANFMVSTVEAVGATGTTILAIVLPVLAALGVLALISYVLYRLVNRRPASDPVAEKSPPKQLLL